MSRSGLGDGSPGRQGTGRSRSAADQPFEPDALTLAGLVGVSFFLRVALPFAEVFQDDAVVFLRTDPWYHMRLVDSLIHSFPQRIDFDPYVLFPGGQWTRLAPLMHYLVALPAWILGAGAPTAKLVETIAALTPALLGAGAVLPVWWLGSRLLGPTTGFLAALLTALIPGHFLTYSLLGFTDHHAAELFFGLATVTLMALGGERLVADPAGGVRAGAGLLAAAGVALGAYLLAWTGGGLLLAVVFAWGGLQVCLERLRGGAPLALAIAGVGICLIAWALVAGLGGPRYFLGFHRLALIAGALGFGGLGALAWAFQRAGASPKTFVLAVVVASSAGLALCFWLLPDAAARLFQEVQRFVPGARARTVGEVQSLLFPAGRFDPRSALFEFGPAIVVAPVGAVLLLRRIGNDPTPGRVLILMWSVATVLLCVTQVRFAVYAAPMVALLAALPCARWLESTPRPGAALGVVGALLILPTAVLAMGVPPQVRGPDPGWRDALGWMRENTPDPFAEPDRYLRYRPGPPEGEDFVHPESAYGVLTWWDYGYWVSRLARRVPMANPTQTGAADAASLYLETRPGLAQGRLRAVGARYVLVDGSLVAAPPRPGRAPGGKFAALAAWAEQPSERYYETFHERADDGSFVPRTLFHPDYYRTLVVRLASFGGRSIPADRPAVARFRRRAEAGGGEFKELLSLRYFDSQEAALADLARHPPGEAALVGVDPRRSCVQVPAVWGLSRVYPPRGVRGADAEDDPSRSDVAIFAVR